MGDWSWSKEDLLDDFGTAYRSWLVTTMGAHIYTIMFDVLYDTPFEWNRRLPRDEDRAADGRWLRRRFINETGYSEPEGMLDHPCSFLEFVIALAYSIEDKIMYDPKTETNVATWFWVMMGNAGFERFTNDYMTANSFLAYGMLVEKANMIMKRRYSETGDGGFFPMENPEEDQRKVEIWPQANAYFVERNYFMEAKKASKTK